MKRVATAIVGVAFAVLVFACSESADDLYTRGHAIWTAQKDAVEIDTTKVREGYEALDEFLLRFPNDPRADDALFIVAWSQDVLGHHMAAAESFVEFYRKNPENPRSAKSLILAGQIFDNNEEYEKARECYRLLIRRFPEHEFVKNGSAQWLMHNIGQPLDSLDIPFESMESGTPGSGS